MKCGCYKIKNERAIWKTHERPKTSTTLRPYKGPSSTSKVSRTMSFDDLRQQALAIQVSLAAGFRGVKEGMWGGPWMDEGWITDKLEERRATIHWAQKVLHSEATARTHPTMVSKVVQRGHEREVK